MGTAPTARGVRPALASLVIPTGAGMTVAAAEKVGTGDMPIYPERPGSVSRA